MKTKLVDTVYIDKKTYEKDMQNLWKEFLKGNKETPFEPIFNKFEELLKERWIVLEDDFVYDHNIKACWLGLMRNDSNFYPGDFGCNYSIKGIEKFIKETHKNENLAIPTIKEVEKSILYLKPEKVPFKTYRKSSIYGYSLSFAYRIICKNNLDKTRIYDLGNHNYSTPEIKNSGTGIEIPILRLTTDNNFGITNRETFFRFIVMGLIPTSLKDDEDYLSLIKEYKYEVNNFFNIKKISLKQLKINSLTNYLINKLANEDTIRANLTPYTNSVEQGYWSLWDMDSKKNDDDIEIKLKKKLVARNPASNISEGIVGIDFGTKSTVVVYQKDSINIYPMMIERGGINKVISAHHYENPTIMEFNNLESFVEDYNSKEYRPETKWEDLTISHTAYNSFVGSNSNYFNTFLDGLKQWAGDKERDLRVIDKNENILEIPTFLNIDKEFNPIEVYAYYLGLYINNQHNGIFLDYILSFPVTYEKAIREKILKSFEKGLKKSLPSQLDKKYIDKLSVKLGTSEPAAYAIVALEEYGFEPEGDERIFYGVFDFGGGTTDFDFGIFREADDDKERRYDYVIEHFGAGGDKYLGGENLLELLAFEIFKENREKLLENSIQFVKHIETNNNFMGSELLLSNSREAKLNTKILVEELRGLWENDPEKEGYYDSGILSVNLTDREGSQIVNFELDINKEKLIEILYKRIEKGVKAFFEQLRLSFSKQELNDINKINIFLAGNSSKSTILKEIFNKEIEEQENMLKKGLERDDKIFTLFDPLSSDENNIEKPTGKTGVAFGLIKSRESGEVLVIDHDMDEDIEFKFYLGFKKKKYFKVSIDIETKYNEWINFIDAQFKTFEMFYTANPLASTNKLLINDENIKKIRIELDTTDENANVYIRLVSPNEFEYVVATEEGIENKEYLSEIKKVSLK